MHLTSAPHLRGNRSSVINPINRSHACAEHIEPYVLPLNIKNFSDNIHYSKGSKTASTPAHISKQTRWYYLSLSSNMTNGPAASILPKDKFDVPALEWLKTIPISEVKPLLPELIEWIADINWPIADHAIMFLLDNVPVTDLVPRLHGSSLKIKMLG